MTKSGAKKITRWYRRNVVGLFVVHNGESRQILSAEEHYTHGSMFTVRAEDGRLLTAYPNECGSFVGNLGDIDKLYMEA